MTTPNDNLTNRITSEAYGPGRESTVGVPIDGYADPTGEYPKRDYFYGSSVNQAARGIKVNNLTMNGGDISVSMYIPPQKASSFPFNDVRETPSGHVIEIDDTPGGERILIKHRLGGGLELRADGSCISSAPGKRVTVTGSDDTVIVEGHGNIIYKGDVTLSVSGDYNVNVGGNHNVNVAGSESKVIRQASHTDIGNNKSLVVQGDVDTRIVGSNSSIVLGDDIVAIKGSGSILIGADMEICAGTNLSMTAEDDCIISAVNASLTAGNLSVMGARGTIGGTGMEHHGSAYRGTTFYGTLVGKASEAWTAEFAQKADEAHSAFYADAAGIAEWADKSAISSTATGPAEPPLLFQTWETTYPLHGQSGIIADPDYLMLEAWNVFDPLTIPPDTNLIGGMLGTSDYGIRNVDIDPNDDILNTAIKLDNYGGLFQHTPTTAEVRHILRETSNLDNMDLVTGLIAEGRLSATYGIATPTRSGRTASAAPSPRFGYNVIGNNPMENRSKRFKPTR